MKFIQWILVLVILWTLCGKETSRLVRSPMLRKRNFGGRTSTSRTEVTSKLTSDFNVTSSIDRRLSVIRDSLLVTMKGPVLLLACVIATLTWSRSDAGSSFTYRKAVHYNNGDRAACFRAYFSRGFHLINASRRKYGGLSGSNIQYLKGYYLLLLHLRWNKFSYFVKQQLAKVRGRRPNRGDFSRACNVLADGVVNRVMGPSIFRRTKRYNPTINNRPDLKQMLRSNPNNFKTKTYEKENAWLRRKGFQRG